MTTTPTPEPISFLRKFCERMDMPFSKRCPHCKQMHEAQRYHLGKTTEEGDRWFTIDYGRCAAMTDPKQCFKSCAPISKAGRDEMRALFRELR